MARSQTQIRWDGPSEGYRFFHLGDFFQAVRPDGEVACTCAAPGQPFMNWPRGGSHCEHAKTLGAVAALGMPEGFGRDFDQENVK